MKLERFKNSTTRLILKKFKLFDCRYLCSNTVLTEADIRLFMTLVRFDEVYIVYFKVCWFIKVHMKS